MDNKHGINDERITSANIQQDSRKKPIKKADSLY